MVYSFHRYTTTHLIRVLHVPDMFLYYIPYSKNTFEHILYTWSWSYSTTLLCAILMCHTVARLDICMYSILVQYIYTFTFIYFVVHNRFYLPMKVYYSCRQYRHTTSTNRICIRKCLKDRFHCYSNCRVWNPILCSTV